MHHLQNRSLYTRLAAVLLWSLNSYDFLLTLMFNEATMVSVHVTMCYYIRCTFPCFLSMYCCVPINNDDHSSYSLMSYIVTYSMHHSIDFG